MHHRKGACVNDLGRSCWHWQFSSCISTDNCVVLELMYPFRILSKVIFQYVESHQTRVNLRSSLRVNGFSKCNSLISSLYFFKAWFKKILWGSYCIILLTHQMKVWMIQWDISKCSLDFFYTRVDFVGISEYTTVWQTNVQRKGN